MYGGTSNTAVEVMRIAFHSMFSGLTKQLGADPSTWTWGKVHQRELENLVVSGLNYGPKPDRRRRVHPSGRTGLSLDARPSWRMVVDWGAKTFQGIYPGGQEREPRVAVVLGSGRHLVEGRLRADAHRRPGSHISGAKHGA